MAQEYPSIPKVHHFEKALTNSMEFVVKGFNDTIVEPLFGGSSDASFEAKDDACLPCIPVPEYHHSGTMNCNCALAIMHDLKPMRFPLPADGLNHRDDKCKWDCCGESWSITACSCLEAKLEMDKLRCLGDAEKTRMLEVELQLKREAELHERLNPPPVYPSDDGIAEQITEKMRKLRQRQAACDADPAQQSTTDNGLVSESEPAGNADFFTSLANTLNPIPLMGSIGETAVNSGDSMLQVLGAIGAMSLENIILPIIAAPFGFDRKELNEAMSDLAEASDEAEYENLIRRIAVGYTVMLDMDQGTETENKQTLLKVQGWIDSAVQSWNTVIGPGRNLVHVPLINPIPENPDLLTSLIGELGYSFTESCDSSHSAMLSLAATLSPTRHMTQSVFIDWFVMVK